MNPLRGLVSQNLFGKTSLDSGQDVSTIRIDLSTP